MVVKYDRIRKLFGEDFERLRNAKVLLLGVGGVGSFCLDCLYRSGVEQVTIVDFDTYDLSNQNRQMWSELHEGEVKVEALKSHYPNIEIIAQKIDPQWVAAFDFEPYDLVLDAIDDIDAKVALVAACHSKLVSATGSAKKLDPTQIQVADIWKTHGDKFASKIRYELRRRRISYKYPCVFSPEPPVVKEKGSFMGVTAAFGLTLCSFAIRRLLQQQK